MLTPGERETWLASFPDGMAQNDAMPSEGA